MAKIIFSRSSCMILDTNSELLLPYLLGYNSLLLPGFLETSSVAVGRVRGPSPWPRRRPKKQTMPPLLIAHLRGAKAGLRDSRLVAPAAGASSRNAASAAGAPCMPVVCVFVVVGRSVRTRKC